MSLLPSVKTWKVLLKVGQSNKTYKIRIQKGFGCCKEFDLIVNNEEIANRLTLHLCSPFYKLRGEFGWEQDDNTFLLARDSLLFTLCGHGKYRLFVNRFESETGLELAEFWRQRGWQHLFVGICLMALGVGLALIVYYMKSGRSFMLGLTSFLLIFAVLVISFGIFLIVFKHKNPADLYVVQKNNVNAGFSSEEIEVSCSVEFDTRLTSVSSTICEELQEEYYMNTLSMVNVEEDYAEENKEISNPIVTLGSDTGEGSITDVENNLKTVKTNVELSYGKEPDLDYSMDVETELNGVKL